jgi:hypothetical protein
MIYSWRYADCLVVDCATMVRYEQIDLTAVDCCGGVLTMRTVAAQLAVDMQLYVPYIAYGLDIRSVDYSYEAGLAARGLMIFASLAITKDQLVALVVDRLHALPAAQSSSSLSSSSSSSSSLDSTCVCTNPPQQFTVALGGIILDNERSIVPVSGATLLVERTQADCIWATQVVVGNYTFYCHFLLLDDQSAPSFALTMGWYNNKPWQFLGLIFQASGPLGVSDCTDVNLLVSNDFQSSSLASAGYGGSVHIFNLPAAAGGSQTYIF